MCKKNSRPIIYHFNLPLLSILSLKTIPFEIKESKQPSFLTKLKFYISPR